MPEEEVVEVDEEPVGFVFGVFGVSGGVLFDVVFGCVYGF